MKGCTAEDEADRLIELSRSTLTRRKTVCPSIVGSPYMVGRSISQVSWPELLLALYRFREAVVIYRLYLSSGYQLWADAYRVNILYQSTHRYRRTVCAQRHFVFLQVASVHSRNLTTDMLCYSFCSLAAFVCQHTFSHPPCWPYHGIAACRVQNEVHLRELRAGKCAWFDVFRSSMLTDTRQMPRRGLRQIGINKPFTTVLICNLSLVNLIFLMQHGNHVSILTGTPGDLLDPCICLCPGLRNSEYYCGKPDRWNFSTIHWGFLWGWEFIGIRDAR